VTVMEKYQWEVTRTAIVATAFMALIVVTRLVDDTPGGKTPPAKNARLTSPSHAQIPPLDSTTAFPDPNPVRLPAKRATVASPPSDPRKFSVGPNELANRYTLLGVERKQVSPEHDDLIVRLHIESLATEPLVSPFESGMLQITSPGLQPINPNKVFRLPLPGGSSRNQDIAFRVPADFRLQDATLRIHYYNYEHEVPLSLAK
jgi:hypothetical protein